MAVYNRVKTWVAEILTPGDLNAEFDAVQAALNGIDAAQINANAVGPSELASLACTTAKLDTEAVTNAKVADGTLQLPKLHDNAVHKGAVSSVTGTVSATTSTSFVDVAGITQASLKPENATDLIVCMFVCTMFQQTGSAGLYSFGFSIDAVDTVDLARYHGLLNNDSHQICAMWATLPPSVGSSLIIKPRYRKESGGTAAFGGSGAPAVNRVFTAFIVPLR